MAITEGVIATLQVGTKSLSVNGSMVVIVNVVSLSPPPPSFSVVVVR